MQDKKGQTALEFLTTYAFTFLIIAIVLFLLLLFALIPKTALPVSCSYYSGFSCIDTAYFNIGYKSQLVVIATNMQPGIVNISNFSATIGYIQSTNGFCTPQVTTGGQTVYCVANFTNPLVIGDSYSATYHISANYCAELQSSGATCQSSAAYSFAGQAKTQGTSYSPLDLPPIPDLFCAGSSSGSGAQAYYASLQGITSGNWIATTNAPTSLENAACSVYRNYIYCVGGSSGTEQQSYYAPLSYTGILAWAPTTNSPVKINDAGCSTYQGNIYCVGSSSAPDNQAYYAPVTSTGIGNWIATTNYPIASNGESCSIYGGFVYCIGSSSGTENQAYYAPITDNGIGNWIATTNYPIQFGGAGCSASNGYIYCVGSKYTSGTEAYYAPISNLGISQWQATTSYPIALSDAGCSIDNGEIYCVGSATSPFNQVYFAPVSTSGIGNWTQATKDYPISMQNAACTAPGSGGGLFGGGGSN
jgi:hypothetical protein